MDKKIICLSAGILLLLSPLYSATLKKGDYRGYKSYILENKYIRAAVIPEVDGRIIEYTYKASGLNFFNFYREKKMNKNPLLLSANAMVIEDNLGGYHDMLWETGWQRNRMKYLAEIIRDSGEEVSMSLAPASQGSVKLERIIRLKDGSTALEIEVKIKNTSADKSYSYWPQSGIYIGGDLSWKNQDDCMIIPVSSRKIPDSFRNGLMRDKPKYPYDGLLVKTINEDKTNHILSQAWWAFSDTKKKLTVGELFFPASIINDKLLARTFSGKRWDPDGAYSSQKETLIKELVFPPVKPGGQRTFETVLVTAAGISRPVYIDENIALGFDHIEGLIIISPVREINNGTVAIYKKQGSEKSTPVCRIQLKDMKPGDTARKKVRLSTEKTQVPIYELEYKIDGKEKSSIHLLPLIK